MNWVRDITGRFPQRPYFELGEIDAECERVISELLLDRHGSVCFPMSTDDLLVLIEGQVHDLDMYADLSREGAEIEGVTAFFRGSLPRVRISRHLSEDVRRENRLRTTLAHELGHVQFHSRLVETIPRSLLENEAPIMTIRTKRAAELGLGVVDWMEWQAGCASVAYLAPVSEVATIVRDIAERGNIFGGISVASSLGREAIRRTRLRFSISEEAARVRLLRLGYLTELAPQPSLFS